MPYNDAQLMRWAKSGGIIPYDRAYVNPASVDLTMGNEWIDFERPGVTIVGDVITLYPRSLGVELYNMICDRIPMLSTYRKPTAILAVTAQWIVMPGNAAGEIKLKTTPTRKGLGHPIADWVDPGYAGKLTLMLHAVKQLTLKAGQRVCQLVVWPMENHPVNTYRYTGHYMHQDAPTLAWDEAEHGN